MGAREKEVVHPLAGLPFPPLFMLRDLQCEMGMWQKYNFPNRGPEDPFYGLVEEVGELAHALLKRKQGIRGTYEEHTEKAKDAIGDWLVFCADFCNAQGWDLQQILEDTWREVRDRDWQRYPHDGRSR